MNRSKTYTLSRSITKAFNNRVDYCVGTGRMGLALQQEYMKQLALVQKEIGFRYIRGHGLFADDIGIYQEYTDENGNRIAEYNFTYLDRIMDGYLELGIRPFLELGFMPAKMASGSQTVFYWKGNVTPPYSYDAWNQMVGATLEHLIERYGRDEVLAWPIEVWNEPNLPGFWQKADMQEYFRLFEESFKTIKAIDPDFQVGGPAICGVEDEKWIREFLDFCRDKKLDIDFVSRHHYVSELPVVDGHYAYVKLHDPDSCLETLENTRSIVDSFEEYKELGIHITEFNTSYVPNAPVHDTNYNAAYISLLLSRMGDMNESYSYWTFGDVFEEFGVPFTPFHGGFGMVANQGIPKPTFWAFKFFKNLQGDCLHRESDSIVVIDKTGKYIGVAWNLSDDPLELNFNLPETEGRFCLVKRTVDEVTCNPLKTWHDLGEPRHLTQTQLDHLTAASSPLFESDTIIAAAAGVELKLTLNANSVVYFELVQASLNSDRGYSYERVISGR